MMDKHFFNPSATSETNIENVSRRSFLKQLGLGSSAFVLATVVPGFGPAFAKELTPKQLAEQPALHKLNMFVSINPDNTTSIVCHRCEMGQGIRTSIPQIIADELEADWDLVEVIQGQADKRYGAQGTAGSTSIRNQFTELRRIGAAARQMLEQAAADIWQVPVSEVAALNHKVSHKPSGTSLSFGELAESASKLEAPKAELIKLKDNAKFNFIGKEVRLFDHDKIVAGEAIYAQDIQLPNMLIASIQRPPVVGGKVVSFDASDALKVKGVVKVVKLKERNLPVMVNPLSGVAVLATNTWAAHEGKKRLKITWDDGPNSIHDTDKYVDELKQKVNTKGQVERQIGDVYAHKYTPERTLEATYSIPYQNHSPMETPAATAWVQGSGDTLSCQIWAGTQNPQWAQGLVAGELGLPQDQVDKVELNITLMGGAFGRKSKSDFILEAVELSQSVGKPVKVVWSREDDIQHGFYHSVSANFMKAELTDNNSADFWIQRVAYPPIGWIFDGRQDRPNNRDLSVGFGDTPFAVKNMSLETQPISTHVRTGWVRSVACMNNGFALGCFVDELADKAGISTAQMWMNLLGNDRHINPKQEGGFDYTNYGHGYDTHPVDTARMKKTIEHLIKHSGADEQTPANEGWGISFFRSFGSYVAAATKVKVENHKVNVLEMHSAIDCGIAVTPDRVKSQMEGAMVFGLSIALMSEITVKNGKVMQSNFHDNVVTRMHQSPPMEVHIVESTEPPGGVGEPGVPPIIPSIVNAIFHASGKRIRELPVNKVMSV